jgi:hypothetical protein
MARRHNFGFLARASRSSGVQIKRENTTEKQKTEKTKRLDVFFCGGKSGVEKRAARQAERRRKGEKEQEEKPAHVPGLAHPFSTSRRGRSIWVRVLFDLLLVHRPAQVTK